LRHEQEHRSTRFARSRQDPPGSSQGELTRHARRICLRGCFAIAGIPVAHHALTTDLGIEFTLAKNVSVYASYLGQFAGGVQDQGARMSLNVTF
jgi:hypothetical protein